MPAEICCSKKGILFEYKHGTISSQPIEILIDYDKLTPFLTEEFKQMVESNEGYTVFNDNIKPEPVNPARQVAAMSTAPAKKTSSSHATSQKSYKTKKSGYYKKPYYTKPKRTNRKRYNGARRRSGRYGHAGRLR